MIILGMDTSSVNATVAVMNDKKLVAEYLISNGTNTYPIPL